MSLSLKVIKALAVHHEQLKFKIACRLVVNICF